MATGKYPFKSDIYSTLQKMIQTEQPQYPEHLEGTDLKDLIQQLLAKVPEDRITIQEIKNHKWVTDNGEEGPIPDLDPEYWKYEAPTDEQVQNVIKPIKDKKKVLVTKKAEFADSKSAAH